MDASLVVVLAIVIFAVLLVAIGVPTALVIHKQRYVRSLTDRGWTFIDSPTTAHIAELGVPPFGRGFDRHVDDLARGRAGNGAWFQCFEYRTRESKSRVLALRMATALPELHVVAGSRPRPGVVTPPIPGYEPLLVTSPDPEFARALLTGPVLQAIAAYGQHEIVDLSLDGNHLTAANLSGRESATIARAADLLAVIVDAFPADVVQRWAQPDPPQHFRFYGHPDWQYEPCRDDLLQVVPVTGGGHSHSTEHVVTSDNDGLPFVAFIHHWYTTETYTTTDAQGSTQTQTREVHHQENLLEFSLPFDSPELSIGPDAPSWLSQIFARLPLVEFELGAFNDQFDVHCGSARFAYDVLHPRQIEYLMATRPMTFIWGNGRARFALPEHDPDLIAWCSDFFYGFLQRVPSFVWKDLQLPVPQVARGQGQTPGPLPAPGR